MRSNANRAGTEPGVRSHRQLRSHFRATGSVPRQSASDLVKENGAGGDLER